MTAELIFKPVAELATLLETGKISSVELVQAFIARTQAVDGRVKAFNSRDEAGALAAGPRLRRAPRARAGEGTARWHSRRVQGRDRGRWPAADVFEQDARELCLALRCDRDGKAESGRCDSVGPTQHGRVCHGFVDGKFRFRRDVQSVGLVARAGRKFGRLGRGGGRRRSARFAWFRHRRFHPPAGRALRYRWTQADLRTRFTLRPRGVCFVARSDRNFRAHGGRRGDRAGRDCRT